MFRMPTNPTPDVPLDSMVEQARTLGDMTGGIGGDVHALMVAASFTVGVIAELTRRGEATPTLIEGARQMEALCTEITERADNG